MIESSQKNWLARANEFIELEANAVTNLKHVLDDNFIKAIEILLNCNGAVIVTGMGKAGHVARKTAATLASTGTPAHFVHPAESVHGDLGMITPNDMMLAFSYRGQTEEVLRMVPYVRHAGIPLIAITSNPDSELSKQSDVALTLQIEREACPLNLAPTASTTAMLALGDVLALVLLEARGFTPEEYAVFHPGGSLGRRLLTRVADLMHTGDDNPVVPQTAPLSEALLRMTTTKMAAATVVNDEGKLVGFFTDGDLRRLFNAGDALIDKNQPLSEIMTKDPKFVTPGMMAVKALEILKEYKIIELPVCDDERHPVGLIHLHDITRAGIT